MPMVIGYHAIFGAYGFWLPNDPRGSWSDFVASWELFRFGEATGGIKIHRSVAHANHDRDLRTAAKKALKFPPVTLDRPQVNSVAAGFAIARDKSTYLVWACSIMPDHVHVVMARHDQDIEKMVGHLKGRATQQLAKNGLHPLAEFQKPTEPPLTVWAENCWKVFLNDDADVRRAVKYVEDNPLREGQPRQDWNFVTPFVHV
jgi:REP element-mobilizing transposase RayT